MKKVCVRIPVKELKKALSIIQDPECENDYIIFRNVEQIPKNKLKW